MDTRRKLATLEAILRGMEGVVVAYSGGVDSTLLAFEARRVLGERALAVTASSPTYPREEVEAALRLAEELGIPHLTIETGEMADPCFTANDGQRCYYCKGELFQRLREIALRNGLPWVADGSNVDDLQDYRPGRKAAEELGVRSPLKEAGLTKDDIRQLSRELGLPTWDKPAMACLASRFPYGTPIIAELLARVARAEEYLRSLGIKQLRVRHHGPIARIEADPQGLALLAQEGTRQEVARRLRELGYTYVVLDLEGYQPGSLNRLLSGGEG